MVKELWPNAKRAAQWHLDVSKKVGMPQYLVTTYDVLGLSSYPYASYNGAFHLLAMKAAEKLAVWMSKCVSLYCSLWLLIVVNQRIVLLFKYS